MTASLVIVIVQGLYKVCNNLLQKKLSPRALQIVNKLLSNMNDRDGFKNAKKSKTLSRCTFLDPRFKLIPFSHNSLLLSTTIADIIESATKIIRAKITDVNNEPEQSVVPDVNMQLSSGIPSIWDDIDSNVAKCTVMGTAKSRAIVEVQRYLEDTIIIRTQDPLKWWKNHAYNYSHLSILAKNTLCNLQRQFHVNAFFQVPG